jgi:carbamoyltransferase
MYTLGINAAFHDSAASLVKDGQLVAAAEEERFTHIKHGKRPVPFSTYELPFHAIHYCLREQNIHISDVDHVAYSFDPWLLLNHERYKHSISLPLEPSASPKSEEWMSVWDPLFLASIVNAPRQLKSGYPHLFQQYFQNGKSRSPRWHFVEHHICHAASSFHASPYQQAAVLTLDGRGEKATTSYHIGDGNELTRLCQVDMPHSLGLLYESVTEYLGFLRSSDEYKVMALASFGKPVYVKEFRSMIHLKKDGRYKIDEYQLVNRFGPPRQRGAALMQRHYDIARSLQQVLEETVLELSSWLHHETGQSNLCLSGGVALNCVLNAAIRDKSEFKHIWVQPAAGDAGTALGAAFWVDAQQRKSRSRPFCMDHVYWGPEYSDDEVEGYLQWTKVPYRRLENVARETAELLAQDKVIGWYQGRMEFGPRALGNRSILASPIRPDMQAKLNEIKDREDFRPVAPAVLEEDAPAWFNKASSSPFMLFVYDIKPSKKKKIPAVCHVDGTARIQTVNRDQNSLYYDLIKAFKEITGVPILVNTSFNTRGEPIVCTPRDAVECFWTSPFDALVINSFLLEK